MKKIFRFKHVLLMVLLVNIVSIHAQVHIVSAHEQKAKDFLNALQTQKNDNGTQVGIVIDPHELGDPYFEIVTLTTKNKDVYTTFSPSQRSNTPFNAFDAIDKSSVTTGFHPKFDIEPDVLITSLNGISAQATDAGRKDWAFFYWNNKAWQLAPTGVGEHIVKDGDIIGFSLTTWSKWSDTPTTYPLALPDSSTKP